MRCCLVINMRKEVVMSEQEFYDLKSAVTAAKRMLDNLLNDKETNYILDSNMVYISGNLNKAYDLLVWGMEE